MKAFTDIEQSKKLAEILPIESADMWWTERYEGKVTYDGQYIVNEEPYYYISFIKPSETNYSQDTIKDIPCWSLAALLNALPKKYYPIKDHKTDLILGKPKDKWCVLYWDATGMQDGEQTLGDNPIDACVEMILKLKEKDLL